MSRRLTLTAQELAQVERLAIVGLRPRTIAFVLGIAPSTLRAALRRDKEAAKAGRKVKADNLYLAIQRGRARGDTELMKVAFELARGEPPVLDSDGRVVREGKAPNVQVLLHLLKSRLGLDGGGSAAAGHGGELPAAGAVIFETQIGVDGVVRQTERPLLDAPAADDDRGDSWLM